MLRKLHGLPGLAAGVLVGAMALSGALLSLSPAIENAAAPSAAVGLGQLAQSVADAVPGVERIVHTASGSVIAYGIADGSGFAYDIDPSSGTIVGTHTSSAVFTFLTELHRSLFLGTAGRAVAGIGALAMAVLSISGLLMLVARLGGWRRLLSPAKGTLAQRLHVELARMAVPGLLLSTLTGLYLSLVTFGFVSDGSDVFGSFPPSGSGETPAAISGLDGLATVPLGNLRELVFPAAGDTSDVFTLTTAAGTSYVDQASGDVLSFVPATLGQQIYDLFYMLHTGQGLWWLGLILGLAALAVPAMAATGLVVWAVRSGARPHLGGSAPAATADTVVLVGSEGNTTWGFAAELKRALEAAGRRVHLASMNEIGTAYPRAQQMFLLTSTYGNGTAPAGANRFLARLSRYREVPAFNYAVLGFGDRGFAHYNAFAERVDATLAGKGWTRLQPLGLIDRQSAQAFAAWGTETGTRLGAELSLDHVPERPHSHTLKLLERIDYGAEIQAPAAVLRFAAASDHSGGRGRLPHFEAGDLIGIVPPGSDIPRYYSLASSTRDGVAEICVRRRQGGACSSFLTGLELGTQLAAFVRRNPDFRPAAGRRPVVMIGNGVGIAPFMGFIRANRQRRPMYLYWGGRNPASDHPYADALQTCVADRRLARLTTAFSRIEDGAYVQDRVLADAERMRQLAAAGAQFLICGSREMAASVAETLDRVLAPLGQGIETLRAKGRYAEDVF